MTSSGPRASDVDPRVAQAEDILSSLREELREVEARAQQAELQTEMAKEMADLRLSAPVLQAQRQAEGVIERARGQAAEQVGRAEATLIATRAQCRQFIRHVQDAVAPVSNADNGIADDASDARRRLLARLEELLHDLSEEEKAGPQSPANEVAYEYEEQSDPEMPQPDPPPPDEPAISSTIAVPIDAPKQTEKAHVEAPLQTETRPVVERPEAPRPAQARARIVQPQRAEAPPTAPDPAWRRKWWARRRGDGSHDSALS